MNDINQTILLWPAVGIGVITALVWGIRVLPALYLADLLISFYLSPLSMNQITITDFLEFNAFTSASLFRCYLGAVVFRYFIGYPNSLTSYRSILIFLLVIAPIITLLSTIYFDVVKYILGFSNSFVLSSDFFNWWFGDFIGCIIFAPITMILIAQPHSIWRPRLITVALPVILILLTFIFIYNKFYENEQDRLSDNLRIKSEVISTKISKSNNWLDVILNYTYSHFLPRNSNMESLTAYFHSLEHSDLGPNAMVWFYNNDSDFVKISKEFDKTDFNLIKTYNFLKLINQYQNSENHLSSTRYNEELKQFINIFEFNKSDEKLVIILIHDFSKDLKAILDNYNLQNVNASIQLQEGDKPINLVLIKEKENAQSAQIETEIDFNNEKIILLLSPTSKYFISNHSAISSFIAKIGFLFAGLIGIMLLIITGKTIYTNLKVMERTFELDYETNQLKKNKKQYQELIEQHPVILWRQDYNQRLVTYISDKVVDLYGFSMNEWLEVENFWLNQIHYKDRAHVIKKIENSVSHKTSFELEYRFIKKDNSIAWIRDVINITNKNDKIEFVGLMIDVTETKEALFGQNISESKYMTLFKYAVDPLIIIDLESNDIIDSNDKAISLLGLNNINGQVSLSDFSPIKQPDGSNSKKQLIKTFKSLINNQSTNFDWHLYNKSHQVMHCNLDIVKLPNQTKNIVLVNINDITEIRQHERKINQLAYYDNLTKLPNRSYFYSKFEYFHDLAIKQKKFGSVIYLDLDRFKILNDTLGHQTGDILLEKVANRIRKASRKKDFCARLGGDEFIILTKKLENSIESTLESTLVVSELISEALNKPYQLGDYEHLITPSIGISHFPMDNTTSDQIIHQADIAMYVSKNKGKNTITIYQDSMVKLVDDRLKIEKALKQALDNDEFELYYQPQYNASSEIISVEALLRWDRAKEFNLNTENIIETIEKVGLTHDLGYWVFDQACAQLEEWQSQGHLIESISINVSAKQFHQKLFVDQVISVIENYSLTPSQLTLELTEAVIIDDMVSLIEKLNKLKNYGVRISLDDFGTGYSSLAYLKHLPIDQLKIDKMFVHDITIHSSSSYHVVKTVIDLASAMDIELIAEGIEINHQFEILKNLGCKKFQGFYFSKALPANKLFKTKKNK